MAIGKVWIEDGCTAYGLCSDICPGIFVLEDVARIFEGFTNSDYEEMTREAAESCPVEVIKYSE